MRYGDFRVLGDSGQSVPRAQGEPLREVERLPADHLSSRREPIKLEVAAIKLASEKSARLIKSTLIPPAHPSSGLSRSFPSLRVPAEYLQGIGRASSSLDLRTNGPSVFSPLSIVQANLNRLWDANDTLTRSRILSRAHRRKMVSDGTNSTELGPSVTDLKRRSCPPVDVNWFSAKRRSCLPSRVGTDSEVLQDRRRTLHTISELSPQDIKQIEGPKESSSADNGSISFGPNSDRNGASGYERNRSALSNGLTTKASQTSLYECNLHRPESLVSEADTSSSRHDFVESLDWERGAPKDRGIKLPFGTKNLTMAFSVSGRSRSIRQRHSSGKEGLNFANGHLADLDSEHPSNYLSAKTPVDETGRSLYYGETVRQRRLGDSGLRRYSSLGTIDSSRPPGRAVESGPFRLRSNSPPRIGTPSSSSQPDSFQLSPKVNRMDLNEGNVFKPVNKPKDPVRIGQMAQTSEGYAQYPRVPSGNGVANPTRRGNQDARSLAQSSPQSGTPYGPVLLQSHCRRLADSNAAHRRSLAGYLPDPKTSEAARLSPTANQQPIGRATSVNSYISSNTLGTDNTKIPRRLSSRRGRPDSTRRRRIDIAKAQADNLAALTGPAPVPSCRMTPECLALLESQQKMLEVKIQRASAAFDRESRQSYRRDGKGSRPASRISQTGHDAKGKMAITDNGPAQASDFEKSEYNEKEDAESSRVLRDLEHLAKLCAAKEKIESEKTSNDSAETEPAHPKKTKKKSRLRKLKTGFMEFIFCGDYQA